MLYLGAASGTTVSHVSDIVGPVSFLLEGRFEYVETDDEKFGFSFQVGQ